MLAQHVLDLVADFPDRIERGARILEDHRDFAAAQIAHLVFARGLDVDAGKYHRALGDLAGAVENPHHRIGRHRFAGTGLADNAERLALGDADVDVLHRLDDAAPGREFDGEIIDVEKGLSRHDALRKILENNPMQSRTVITAAPFPRRAKPRPAITSSAADRRCREGRRRAG
jgi:hypothetical protein